MTRDTVTLEDLRQRMNDLDRQLIELVAERKLLSEEVARVKRATGKPTRDYEREREVIMGVRAMAEQRGVSPALAESLLRLLIRSSLRSRRSAMSAISWPSRSFRRWRRCSSVTLSRVMGRQPPEKLPPFYRGAAGAARKIPEIPLP